MSGAVVVTSDAAFSASALRVVVEGAVTLQLSTRAIGMFDAFAAAPKPIALLHAEIDLQQQAGQRIPRGSTPLPFEFVLRPLPGTQLFDTYHGVYVNVQYVLTASMSRGVMQKAVSKQREILIETESGAGHEQPPAAAAASPAAPLSTAAFPFSVSPSSLQNVKESSKRRIPDFLFTGRLQCTSCHIDSPFEGELVIVRSAVELKSVELQLVRVESCSFMEGAGGEAREATEIQNIQLAEGNVMRGLPIPIFMVFPRLFCCPTTIAKSFRVEFEVNLIVLFADNHMVTENFPIKLYR